MSEGNVYPCQSRKTNDGYEVWVERRPRLRARGETLDEAIEELSSVVCGATGDGEAVFDLLPSASKSDEVAYVTLHYNASWDVPRDFSKTDYAALYARGLCKGCCRGIGPRTNKPLPVGRVETGDLLGPFPHLPKVLVASDRFQNRLTKRERDLLEWRPIDMRGQSRKTYFEVAAKDPMQTVATRSEEFYGWHCPECGLRLFSAPGYDRTFVATADLPKPIPALFAIDDPHLLTIAIPAARWKAMRGKAGMKGIVTRRLVAVPNREVVRRPRLRVLNRADMNRMNRELDKSLGYFGL
jgi:hypothetical protein